MQGPDLLNQIMLVVCAFGFFKEMRPTTSFLTPHLMVDKGFNSTTLYGDVYPVWTYSYLVMLIPVFILTDLLRYKPIIISEAACYVATWVLIIMGKSLYDMQSMQVLFGWATAAEVAYYAYIYAAVDERYYRKATSYVKAATMLGRCLSYGVGQFLVTSGLGDYNTLDYISLGAVSIAFVIGFFLPGANLVWSQPSTMDLVARIREEESHGLDDTTMKPHNRVNIATEHRDRHRNSSRNRRHRKHSHHRHRRQPRLPPMVWSIKYVTDYFRGLIAKIVRCYSDPFVLKWSLWWALGLAGYMQVGNYIQNLWATIYTDQSKVWHGLTEFINTLLGAGIVFSAQYLRFNWPVVGELTLGIFTSVECLLLIWLSYCYSIVPAYGIYIIYHSIYYFLSTVATYNIAKKLEEASFGLVFGCNTFFGLILQTVLTFTVADHHGLHLDIRTQFLVYGCCHAVVAAVFTILGSLVLAKAGWRECFKAADTSSSSSMSQLNSSRSAFSISTTAPSSEQSLHENENVSTVV